MQSRDDTTINWSLEVERGGEGGKEGKGRRVGEVYSGYYVRVRVQAHVTMTMAR